MGSHEEDESFLSPCTTSLSWEDVNHHFLTWLEEIDTDSVHIMIAELVRDTHVVGPKFCSFDVSSGQVEYDYAPDDKTRTLRSTRPPRH